MTQEQKRHIRQLRAAGEGYKRISTLLDIPVGTIKSFCRRDEADEPAVTDYRAPQKLEITIENENPICPQCGTHFPEDEAVLGDGVAYCSERCRKAARTGKRA